MTNFDNAKVNITGLKELYKSVPVARAILDHYAGRARNSWESSVDRLVWLVGGDQFGRGDVISIFRQLEDLKCGRFVAGRRGASSRFQWSVGSISVGKVASGENLEVDEEVPTADADDETMISHRFQLRPGLPVALELPSDLTAAEANRLADFVKTLPFGQ